MSAMVRVGVNVARGEIREIRETRETGRGFTRREVDRIAHEEVSRALRQVDML